MFGQIGKLAARNVMQKTVRFSGHGGVPGEVNIDQYIIVSIQGLHNNITSIYLVST